MSGRLSKPVYESLPWLYMVGGVVAIGAGYHLRTGVLSTLVSLAGFGGIVTGVAVWLRRRDYRATRNEYTGDDERPR